MTRLSVNINKFATLRNARGGNNPDVLKVAKDCEKFGAQGITVHPRPDQRHIRYTDVTSLKPILSTEFNIEGNPIPEFIDLVLKVVPAQVTLVPDAPDQLTSNHGWNPKANMKFLKDTCKRFNDAGIRTSIFIDPIPEMIDYAAETGCKRVELYTAAYAEGYAENREKAIEPYLKAALEAKECGLGLNAGHDLSLENLKYFIETIGWTDEVSIGHALVCDALYLGLENTIKAYLAQLA
jgi:pyridoxine 5-phosphate synthase